MRDGGKIPGVTSPRWAAIRRFVESEDGPTATEYAVMLSLILGSLILVITSTGNITSGWWTSNSTAIVDAISGG